MSKKKSGPKKKPCSRKTCNKKVPQENLDNIEQVEPKVVTEKQTKTEYFLGMIKKAFGYE